MIPPCCELQETEFLSILCENYVHSQKTRFLPRLAKSALAFSASPASCYSFSGIAQAPVRQAHDIA